MNFSALWPDSALGRGRAVGVDATAQGFVQRHQVLQVGQLALHHRLLGGKQAALGDILGPSFSQEDVPAVIGKILDVYVENRIDGESFLETYRRIGIDLFKERAYA